MRSYSMIFPTFWTGRTGKEIKKMGKDVQLLALYLLTSPHAMASHGLGIYYLPIEYMTHDIGAPSKDLTKALGRLIEGEFCNYDPLLEYVWVREMAKFQIGKLKPNDKQVLGIKKSLMNMPASLCFLYDFYQKYQLDFHLQEEAKTIAPSKALTMPLRSQEQEQDQDQEHKFKTFAQPAVERSIFDPDHFDQFWKLYPRKVGKAKALKTWKSKQAWKHLSEILNDLQQRTDWNRNNPFTPHPATYLSQQRWEDEEKTTPQPEKQKKETTLEAAIRLDREKNGEHYET